MVEPDEKETGRIEAFSDGVFAIAITLLVLDIKVPHAQEVLPTGLLSTLLAQWPVYLGYTLSFVTVLVMWINHHRLFENIRRSDDTFLLLNGFLLFTVATVPFPTALMSEYIMSQHAKLATIVFSGWYVLIAVAFNLLWRYGSYNGRLLGEDYDPKLVRGITRQYLWGPLVYLFAFALAWFSPLLSVGWSLLLAIFFTLSPRLLHPGGTKN